MTEDDIRKMDAGREMDALVAEIVMELELSEIDGYYRTTVTLTRYPAPGFTRFDTEPWNKEIPEYSTDIAAAWEVVKKMQSPPDEYFFGIKMTPAIPHKGKPCWHVELGGIFAYAETAPLAICRAALLAVIQAR
jgi:hypothetical protein